jgi:hypothetical protein
VSDALGIRDRDPHGANSDSALRRGRFPHGFASLPPTGGGKPVREALGIVRPPAGGRGTIPTQVADFEPPFEKGGSKICEL